MLRCVLTDVQKQEVIAPYPFRMSVTTDEAVPADSLSAEFPFFETAELCEISVFEEDRLVFRGIVDEEERVIHPDGMHLRIAARSMAALLLDNEAAPCVYDHPSAGLIYERYVKPFGVRCADLDDAVYFGEQTIAKGASCWSVVKRFCAACYSSIPQVGSDGSLYMKGIRSRESLRFGADAIRYLRISELNKRSAELSAVRVKIDNPGGYEMCIRNKNAVERGIRRERYLNALLTESPMRCADRMLENGAQKAYSIKLRCPGCLLGTQGSGAVVSDSLLGRKNDLYVSSLHYQLTENGDYTDVRLKRRNS